MTTTTTSDTVPIRVHRSDEPFPREQELAWRIAALATEQAPIDPVAAAMAANRVVDNAAVSAASLLRRPVAAARAQAVAHRCGPTPPVPDRRASGGPAVPVGRGTGAAVTGLQTDDRAGSAITGLPYPDRSFSPEWAAYANGVAVRELDFHDTFLAAEYSHPGDNIPPLLAVAQHRRLDGAALVRGILTAYEVQVDLARTISLHAHRIDHVAHLGPSVAAGIGAMLGLPTDVVYHAVGQALHTTTATRQSRKGLISSWKAFAPAFAGKAAIEAVDRAMRGETSPAPIYEGEDGVIAWLLDGPDASYDVRFPGAGEPRRAILDSFTKEHSAEYQAQAIIDLARRLHTTHPALADPGLVESIVLHTSHHTHAVIGSGANDPQKYDPTASRETLDHSVPYILAVALQDGGWHHEDSYAPARAQRPDTVALWRRITTVEDPAWTERYLAPEPVFGGRLVATLTDGTVVDESIDVADAHPRGARPFGRAQYEEKFRTLAGGVLDKSEQERFLVLAARLPELTAAEVGQLQIVAPPGYLDAVPLPEGLF